MVSRAAGEGEGRHIGFKLLLLTGLTTFSFIKYNNIHLDLDFGRSSFIHPYCLNAIVGPPHLVVALVINFKALLL